MLIPDIMLAYEGKVEMLKLCFGGAEQKTKTLDTVEAFDRAFG